MLTLAEADAELQRLEILRKNHAEEQYLARRAVRDQPDTIKRFERRIDGLTTDMTTLAAHEDEPLPGTEGLGKKLDATPDAVRQTQRFPLGKYRGLEFGLIMHALGGTEAYMEGATTRKLSFLKDHPGPRAVVNALEKLADGYEADRGRCPARPSAWHREPAPRLRGTSSASRSPIRSTRVSWLTCGTG